MIAATRYNVLLISIDALRADHVGLRGVAGISLTPVLDEIRSQGVDFATACSPTSYTWGTFASLFLSAYPGAVTSRRGVLTSQRPTLAEILQANGYATAGLNSNPFISASFGYNRGFDHFDDGMVVRSTHIPNRVYPILAKAQRFLMRQPYLPAATMNRKAIRWLHAIRANSNPFFLWLHYMDVHGPYQSKKGLAYLNKLRAEWLWHKAVNSPEQITPAEHEELIRTYREEISYTDRHIGLLLQKLREMQVYDDTIVVVCSDHGDEFREHGRYAHWRQLYDELVRVLLIVRHPEAPGGRRVSTPVSLVDVVPTLVDMLGLDVDRSEFVGQSLSRAVRLGHTSALRDFVVGDAAPDRDETVVSIRTARWKLIIDSTRGGAELYDLEHDPGETLNVVEKQPMLVERLETQLWAELGDQNAEPQSAEGVPRWSPSEEQEVLSRLRALGYVDWVEDHEHNS